VSLGMLSDPPPEQAKVLRGFWPLLEDEYFVLGGTRGPVPQWPLESFFDGLETDPFR
jgi:hypothetical protein